MATENHSDEIARLIDRGNKDPRTHTFARLADLYRKAGDLDRALGVIERGLKHHPHYLNARLVHARVLRQLGQPEAARGAFEHVLQIDSENLVARAALDELGTAAAAPEAVPDQPAARPEGPAASRWLARLDADWRKVRAENGAESGEPVESGGSSSGDPVAPGAHEQRRRHGAAGEIEVVSEATEQSAEKRSPEAPEPDAGPDDDDAPPQAEAPAELETATLAALYLRQGLFDRAIEVYERLLARDPYNARLAGALEEARRRTQEGPKASGPGTRQPKAGSPFDPPLGTTSARALGATGNRPESVPTPLQARQSRRATDAPPGGSPTRTPGVSIRAHLGQILDGEAADAARASAGRWSEWLDRLQRGRD